MMTDEECIEMVDDHLIRDIKIRGGYPGRRGVIEGKWFALAEVDDNNEPQLSVSSMANLRAACEEHKKIAEKDHDDDDRDFMSAVRGHEETIFAGGA